MPGPAVVPSLSSLTDTQRSVAAADLIVLSCSVFGDYGEEPSDPVVPPAPSSSPTGPPGASFPAWAFLGVTPHGQVVPAPQVGLAHLPLLSDGRTPREFINARGGRSLSFRTAGKLYGVSSMSVSRARGIYQVAPDLIYPLRNGELTLNDAVRIRHEPEMVRWQAVEAVRRGDAASAVRAIRRQHGRRPVTVPDPSPPPWLSNPDVPVVRSVLCLTPTQRSIAAADLYAIATLPSADSGLLADEPELAPHTLPDVHSYWPVPNVDWKDLPLGCDGRTPDEEIDATTSKLLDPTLTQLAAFYGVTRPSVFLASFTHDTAPDLGDPMRQGVITLNDAAAIRDEPEAVRRQLVQDLRDGTEKTAVRALRRRYRRDPVPPAPPSKPLPKLLKKMPKLVTYVGNGRWVHAGHVRLDQLPRDIIEGVFLPEEAEAILRVKDARERPGGCV